MNLNADYYEDFKRACELTEKDLSHAELIEILENGNIPEKQFAALNLDSIKNESEGRILVKNLTGCDGKIREAVALKINQMLSLDSSVSNFLIYPEIFADASIDINANICRMVIDSVAILKNNLSFKETYINKILAFIQDTFIEIDKFIFRDKKYVINKQLFKLYWCLESLKLFVDDIPQDELLKILERASKEKEYTIREKVAQILVLTNNKKFLPLIEELKQDENYYVKAAIKNC